MHGIVDKLFEDRHYGFIEAEGGGRCFFSTHSVIGEQVSKGDSVRFELRDDSRKSGEVIAVSVEKLESARIPEPRRLFVGGLPRTVTEAALW